VSLPDRALTPATLAAVLALLLIASRLLIAGDSVTWFICAGSEFVDPTRTDAPVEIRNASGYDGQFFYRLALEPNTAVQTDHGVRLDVPAYRQQRIGYPVLAWLASFGGTPWLVPWALLLLNVLGLALLGFLGGLVARSGGQHAALGLLLPAYPGLAACSLAGSLAEITAIAAAGLALVALRRGRLEAAAIAFGAAALTRETTLILPAAYGVVWLVDSLRARRLQPGIIVWAMPLLALVAWHAVLAARWGIAPTSAGANNVSWPLLALGNFVIATLQRATTTFWLRGWIMLAEGALILGAAALALTRGVGPRHERLALVLATGLFVSLSSDVWVSDWAFLRAGSEVFLLAALSLVGLRPGSRPARIVRRLLGLELVLWIIWVAARL
jgi:hypothetical protein